MSGIKDILFADTQHYQGKVDQRFLDLAVQFSRLQVSRGALGGAALAVYFQGELVVDIFTGNKSATEAWAQDTLSICYSTGKGVLATLAHIMVSQGILDYDTPIMHYWPEFAQNDKENITLRHVLSHQSGLYDIRNMIAAAVEMADWPHMLQVMERARPRFIAGQDIAYQALSFGWLVGGVLEKASGQSLAALMQQYLVKPLDLDGAYFGLPTDQLSRVARMLPQSSLNSNFTTQTSTATSSTAPSSTESAKTKTKAQSAIRKAKFKTSNIPQKLLEFSGQNPQDFLDAMVPKAMRDFSFFSDVGLQSVIPAVNGAFSAVSLAKIYAMLANQGQWQGQQLINAEVFEQLSQIQSFKRDRVMPIPMKWRLGYHRVISLGKRAKTGFGHIGYNGSGAWCDPERQLSFAYTHNFPVASITGDYRLWGLTQEALRCADAELKGRKGWF
ncbi:CubicO group peptidase (beta-lactamase class C family) [Acinetobacter calcoaceticus]|uniref:CubicO group peptidase (Beta-lactamase class C family) n=1 Tax=Acinetobacter calcoaceticus TaxID=471 RepID=A0A4R1XWR9_ACICA|nr:CubicO group peptidase (beta-lactamase class C family) [Acinetobacter calcoaceticus]